MNHNSFLDRLKKEAKKQRVEERVVEIAKLHLEASKEVGGVYYLEFANELIVACHQKKLDSILDKREDELSQELVGVYCLSVDSK